MYDSARFARAKSSYQQQPASADKTYFNQSGYGPELQNRTYYMMAEPMPSMRPMQMIPAFPPHPLSLDNSHFTAPRTGAHDLNEANKSHSTSKTRRKRINSTSSNGQILKSQGFRNKRSNAQSRSSEKQTKEEPKTSRKKPQSKKRGPGTKLNEEDVWSSDVQKAFEEALALAPKQGMYKVKLEEKIIGRNGLISSYILHKTGKFRSRKQVSSHIQVVKNLGKDKSLIDYINKGPTFETPEDEEEYRKKLYKEFKKVFSDKSFFIQFPKNEDKSPTPDLSSLSEPEKQTDLNLAKFEFLINNYEFGYIRLTSLIQSTLPSFNPFSMTANFPGIENFFTHSAPIIHNKVKICPNLYATGSELSTNFEIVSSDPDVKLNCFTMVMSRGYEVLRANEKNFMVNTKREFLTSFWECLFEKSSQQTASLALTLLGITVKQVLYEPMDSDGTFILKSSIRATILWEFEIVHSLEEAITVSNRVQLPLNFPKTESILYNQEVLPASPCNSFSSDSSKLDIIYTGMQAVPGGIESELPLENTNAPPPYPPSHSMLPPSQFYIPMEGAFCNDNSHPSVNLNLATRNGYEYTTRGYNI